jgi:hypothetical protein
VSDKYRASVEALVTLTGTNGQTTFSDVGPDGRTVTRNGNTIVDTAQNPFGMTDGSGLFDGTGDYLSLAHSADFSVTGTTPFCIEVFFRIEATGRSHTISNKRSASSAQEHSLSVGTTQTLSFSMFASGSSVLNLNDPGIVLNEWSYVAAIRDASNLTRLMRGVAGGMATVRASATQSGSPSTNTSALLIGRDGFDTGRDMLGRIAWYRFTKGDQRYRAFPYPVPRGPYSLGKRAGVSGEGTAPVTLFA